MKVLIISSNTLPAAPTGPVYVAGAVRQAGHEVQIYERLFAADPASELSARLSDFQPDVVGISIRLVFGDEIDPEAPLGARHTDLKPRVKELVDVVRQNSPAQIVLGGPGFNYYAHNWLEYLDLDYGIRGEGEEAFPLFLERLAEGGDITSVPGCAIRKDGYFHSVPPHPVQDLDGQALPAYDLLDWQPYAARKITPAVLTKRGCAFSCTYCPYSKLEGKRYRLKSPQRVLAEARHILDSTNSRKIMFCENNFNAPRRHAEAICRVLIAEKADFQWGTGDLRPMGVSDDFCRLMEDSGCFYANLSIESASGSMLKSMKRGYTVGQVRESLEALNKSTIPFGVSLMFGAPGETPETIAETLSVLDDYEIPNGVWVTIGVYLWTDYQDIVAEARQTGVLKNDKELFNGCVYLSPGLPKDYLRELPDMLRARKGYSVQFNKPGEDWIL
ncbi:MAG: B12-binding domain-containing radical SAM protein [Omnitrophica WOR_2 bacterium]